MMVTRKVINLSGEFTADEMVEALCAVGEILDELCDGVAAMLESAEEDVQQAGLATALMSAVMAKVAVNEAARKVAYHGAGLD